MATTTPPTRLQDIAKMKGYNLNYDPNSKQVTIMNPKTNQSINFQSGQGQEYGLGGLVGGSNVVSNLSALDKALSQAPTPVNNPAPYTKDTPLLYPTMGGTPATNATPPPVAAPTPPAGQPTQTDQTLGQQLGQIPVAQQQAQPQPQPVPAYVSPYQNQIGSLLEKLTKQITSPTQYNPNADAGLQQAQEQARNQALQEMARRGLLYSEGTKSRLQQAGQQLIPQYEQLFRQQQQQQAQNIGDLLGTLSGLEQTGYNRFASDLERQQQAADRQTLTTEKQALAKKEEATAALKAKQDAAKAMEDKQKQLEETYGRALTPETTQLLSINIPTPIRSQLAQYSGDYAAEINRRYEADPNDPVIPYLQRLRAEKVLGDPELSRKYGVEYGIPTLKAMTELPTAKTKELEAQSKALELEAQPYKIEQELTKGSLDNLGKELDNYIKRIEAKYAGTKAELDIQKIMSDIQNKDLDSARQSIINSNLNEREKAEINKLYSDAEETSRKIISTDAKEAYSNLKDKIESLYMEDETEPIYETQPQYNSATKQMENVQVQTGVRKTGKKVKSVQAQKDIRTFLERMQDSGLYPEEAVDKLAVEYGVVTNASDIDKSNYPQNQKKKISSAINTSAKKHNVEPALIEAIIKQESGYNPKAKSGVGAQGLMQLMPDTARGLGVKDAWDINQNVDGGTRFIKDMLRQFDGNLELALAAYNAGPGNVKKYGGIPPFKETQNYVKKVTQYYNQLKGGK